MPTGARIEAMLIVSAMPLRAGVLQAPAGRVVERPGPDTPGISVVTSPVAYASAEAHPESYWAAEGPFWPAALMHRRSVQLLGHEAIVARFPARLQFDVLCVIEALEDCELVIEMRHEEDVIFASPPRTVRPRAIGHGETLQAERYATVQIPISFDARDAGLYTVIALIEGIEAATVKLVVRLAAD
jgi:hypothetical protein